MLSQPGKYIEALPKRVRIGFRCVEVAGVGEVLKGIRALGKQVGLVINPKTPASAADRYLEDIDFLLVMTVEPVSMGKADLMPLTRYLPCGRLCALWGVTFPSRLMGV